MRPSAAHSAATSGVRNAPAGVEPNRLVGAFTVGAVVTPGDCLMPRLFTIALLALSCASVRAADVVSRDELPLDVRVHHAPTWIAARDGRHALYELHIVNYGARALMLETIEVRDGYSKALRRTLAGRDLIENLLRPGLDVLDGQKTQLEAGQSAVLFLHATAPSEGPAPESLAHRIIVRGPPDSAAAAQTPFQALDVQAEPVGAGPLVLGRVLRGAGWVAADGLGDRSDHRRALITLQGRATIAQRHAIDFVRIGPNGRLTRDGSEEGVEAWFGYGAEVLAAADGVVMSIENDIPDNRPLSGVMAARMALDTIAGNYVLLDVGGAYLLYGHLQPGSLQVEVGEQVRRGQTLARVGNSGRSDGPHLHVHVVDRPAPFAGEGVAFVFDRFAVNGRIDDLDAFIANQEHFLPDARQQLERATPLLGEVVDFGGQARGDGERASLRSLRR